MKEVKNEAFNIKNDTIDCISRCPECNLVPSLKLIYDKKGYPSIIYNCENNHNGNMLLKEYLLKYNNKSLIKEKCGECGKIQKDIKGDYFYCGTCNKFLCYLCQLKHPNGDDHDCFNFKKYDSLCKEDSNFFCAFCKQCKKHICIFCKTSHEGHELFDLSKITYSKESKNKLKEEINIIEMRIRNLSEIKQKINSQIEILIQEIQLLKILSCSRKFEESQKNLNYNIFQNLENFRKDLKSKNSEFFEKIFEQGNKFISLFNHKIQVLNSKDFKILEYHSDAVIFLLQLKDGRLASSSTDYCLNIYKLNSYELQLSIKDESRCRSFIQINDGRIIACYDDGTIKVIKLINENKYQIDQNIKGHSSFCRKVIEIKNNELISISFDNTMRIWKFNENKFNCIKTIKFQNNSSFCNILILNKNEVVTSSCGDKCLKFWNSENYQLTATINNIETDWTTKNMCLLEDDILCIGGSNSKGFYLIKISTHEIVKNIKGPKNVYSIDKCKDGMILCSIINENENNSLIKYKYENLELKKKVEIVKAHPSNIYSCIELDNEIIAFGDLAHKILLWER